MNIYYVYQYLRSKDSEIAPSGTPYYVGKGKNKRAWKKGLHEVHPPTDSSNIVLIAENLSESQAFELEKQLIAEFGRVDLGTGILRNKTAGGLGGAGTVKSDETKNKIRNSLTNSEVPRKHSKETRAKMSASRTKANRSPETLAKMAASLTGRTLSEEHKAKISAATKGKPKKNPVSEETRNKFRRPQSVETRNKISAALKGRKLSEEHKAKITQNLLRKAKKEES